MSKKTALITGVTGFTGPYVRSKLEEMGYVVYGLTHTVTPFEESYFNIDLLNITELKKVVKKVSPDVVIHLAAISYVAHADVSEIYNSNITGTRNLLEALAALTKKPKSVVLASTANVYGTIEGQPIGEDAPLIPGNDYAVSKLAMEYMSYLWREKLPITIVRPFNYTGVGQSERFLIPKIVSHFARGDKKIELGNIDVYRDFSDVRMVAEIYAGLAEKETKGMVFNVCSGNQYSLSDILIIMSDIAGYKIEVDINPAFVRHNEIKKLVGNNQRILEELGEVNNFDLRHTLSWMYLNMKRSV